MAFLKNRTIKSSLLFAFGLLCAFTILSSSIGLYANSQLRADYQIAVEEKIPSIASMVHLSTETVLLTNLVPQLYNAENDSTRRKYWRRIQDSIDLIVLRLQYMLAEMPRDENLSLTISQFEKLRLLIQRMDGNVKKRIIYKEEIKRSYSQFIKITKELIHLVNIYNNQFKSSATLRDTAEFKPSRDITARLQITVYRTVNIINSIYSAVDSKELVPLGNQLNEVTAKINNLVHELEDNPQLSHLYALAYKLRNVTMVDRNIFKLRAIEKTNRESSNSIFGEAEIILDSVNYKIGEYVNKIQIDSILSSQAATIRIKFQHIMMILIVSLSIFFSITVMWLYVKRRILDRMQALNYSMTIISSGDLAYRVPVSGVDEIGDMATSLISFRDQLNEKQFELIQTSKLAAIGQLSTGISHEINQPLAAIGHYSRNGSRMIDCDDLKGASKNFENIARLVKKATKITSRLKSIARKPQEKLYKVNLYESVKNVLEILSSHPSFKLVEMTIDINKDNSDVFAEQVQLEQVILNLVTNAIDALETVEGIKEISIHSMHTGDFVYLNITDNGIGIPADLQGKIFDPFFTTKNADKGLGLGLAISYSIVKSFGGNIRMTQNLDKGSNFTTKLVAIN
jgi:two-component system C4-dicarboxylate transport sensor histidine kinase DctB